MYFRALLIDDLEVNLNVVTRALLAELEDPDVVRRVLLVHRDEAVSVQGDAERGELYDEIWVVNGAGQIDVLGGGQDWKIELDDRDLIFFLPYRMQTPADVFSGASWALLEALGSRLLSGLDMIIVDCNLDLRSVGMAFFTQGTVLLLSLLGRGLPMGALKVLSTAQPDIDPALVATIPEPKLTVADKKHESVLALLGDRWRRFMNVARGQKPAGLTMRYAELFNSTSGAEVGHGLSTSHPLSWARHMITTRDHLRRLSRNLTLARFQDDVFRRESERVSGFQAKLDRVGLAYPDCTEGPGVLLARLFGPAFTVDVPTRVITYVEDGPSEGVTRITSFEQWRKKVCSVYLNSTEPGKSWTYALGRDLRKVGAGLLEVTVDLAENVEIFVPREWLLEIIKHLCDVTTFLRHVVETARNAGRPVHISICTEVWDCPYKENVFKAALILSYDGVLFPDLSAGAFTPRALDRLVKGAFAVESLEYFYDWYLVRGVGEKAEVYGWEIDGEQNCLKPRLLSGGAVLIWPALDGKEGCFVSGAGLLRWGHTSGLMFIFEGQKEPSEGEFDPSLRNELRGYEGEVE